MWTMFCRDLWAPMWPNLAASVAWTLPALAWHHRRLRTHIRSAVAEAAARPKEGTQ